MRRWTLVGSLALACSDESPIPEADVADVCGEPGPVQILPLEREEVVDETWIPVPHGDRFLYGVRTFDHPISNVVIAQLDAAHRGYAELEARIESIDRCGSDRRVVAEGVDTVIAPRDERSPWLALRRETRTLFWFDPDGAFAPRELAPLTNLRSFLLADDVVYVFREDKHTIVRFTLLGDEPNAEIVLDHVIAAGPLKGVRELDRPELLLALRDDGELLSLDVRMRRLASIASGVRGIVTDSNPRFVVWWPGDSGELLPTPVTEATAVDVSRGVSRSLALGDAAPLAFAMQGPVLATMYYGPDPRSPSRSEVLQTRLTFLPEMKSILLDGEWDVHGSASGNRFAARSPIVFMSDRAIAPAWYVFESGSDGVRILGGPFQGQPYEGALWSRECVVDDAIADAAVCDVVRLPFDTLRPEVVAPRTWSSIALPDDRWLIFTPPSTPPEAARPDSRGTLRVVDGTAREESLLARDVSPGFQNLQPHEVGDGVWHTDEIVYQVRALSGDRTGLWRARFE